MQGGDHANSGALSGYVGSAEVKETSFQKGGNQANTGGLSGYVGSAEVEEMNSGTGSASDFPKVSPQPTKKEEVRFLFRGSGGGLGMQRVHGGSYLMEWYLGLQGQGLGEDFGGYFTTKGGKFLDPQREVSGLGLCGLQEVVFHGRILGGAARGTGKVEVPNVGEWQRTSCGAAHCWNTRVSCYRCGTHRNWQSGGAGLRVLLVVKVIGMESNRE